ncbi:MAG: ATP-dependent DNA helicase [Actinomycetota bacterium]|nr:ATP-dependent DNA helicase [Actinomycetota bacterium]
MRVAPSVGSVVVEGAGLGGAPRLEGDALAAVRHRGSHVQIIAAAGSGKTEVVSQRVADLLAEGVAPEGIVAFTFTQRAAEELTNRIARRVEGGLGRAALDRLNGLYVGTIHGYCFRLLQQRVPRYETYDVLDDNQLTALLSREAQQLGLRELDPGRRLFAAIRSFRAALDVVENELLDVASLPEPLRSIIGAYYATLDRYRLLTYGQQVVAAVHELSHPELAGEVHERLRHLIVDEYQDVNPAQERLIGLLTGAATELCVVGDDHQAIYQWRGSDVGNIVGFPRRYPAVATFEITANRRSTPGIVAVANRLSATIPASIPKTMTATREAATGGSPEVVVWSAPTEADEAGWIAGMIDDLARAGVAYKDMAVLIRSRAAYPALRDAFAAFDIPVQPGGRTGLFDQPEAMVLGQTFAWLSDIEWRDPYRPPRAIAIEALLDSYELVFSLSASRQRRLADFLDDWKQQVAREDRRADLVGELYLLLERLDVASWDLGEPLVANRLGTLARFSALLADYESVRRRARPDATAAGEQVGGQDRGLWYYGNLAIHIVNYAQGAYEGFDAESDYASDAVDVTTVHRAKGLEWPVVFVPSMTASRFPTRQTGRPQPWLVPRDRFAAARYEGSDADERRLFYVAVTRARDWLSVSRHDKVTTRTVRPSPYYLELADLEVDPGTAQPPAIPSRSGAGDEPIRLSYSELAAFLDCGMAFRLRNLIGFQPRLAPELGYGKAVHHVMRVVAEATRDCGRVPGPDEIDAILDASFFLPTANKPLHRQLKDAARRLVTTYAAEHPDDLHRVWEVERPFELHLDGVILSGRADVILDHEGGVPTALAIVDYKTSTAAAADHTLQLQVYTDAGRREGLDVRGAYVHDLDATRRESVPVTSADLTAAEETVTAAAARIRARDYAPNPGRRCRTCEVRTVCASARR